MIKAIVTDIEGTTSSLSFVKDVLFPYAREHIADFVRQHKQQAEVARLLDEARQEAGRKLALEALIDQLISWIDQDRKVTPLKSLQGLIWQAGYRQGDYQGHVYEDAYNALLRWRRQGIALYVYSSGSVYAQKLLFGHSDHGDLTPMFEGYFDTHIGAKKEMQSYRRIAEHINMPPRQLLFLSDSKEELDAAREAGFQTCWLVREQVEIDRDAGHLQARSFAEIDVAAIASNA
ncbi:acireductone synthase [Methylomarinum sp. Ch1-1]|uniref:Enolase-phosphatase E1 n=1 Tax=Methylomarinum roseum TaxID=3067653 RepID=A0AAU7NSC9_9GAMM|nr:acireductone synthase [Methylomarinum sp. Ch1-1]MDP4520115.1 acireductone synthase [Methylomarinum sp. Ch1-1]